jgi:hypothetical protein
MNLNRLTVGRAKSEETRNFGELLMPLISRDKMQGKQVLLLAYFKTIADDPESTKSGTVLSIHPPIPINFSGRDHPSFFGSPAKCYQNYLSFCYLQRPLPDKAAIVKTERIFHQQRRIHRIGCEEGYFSFHFLSWCYTRYFLNLLYRDAYSSIYYIKLMNLKKEKLALEEKVVDSYVLCQLFYRTN